jgi:beta-lactamase superfamily II metal-dependent hydrolase
MILSHPDLDHVSGLVALAEDKEVIVREILMQRPWNNLRAASFKDNRITNNSISKRLKEAFDKAAELSEKTAKSVNLCENQGEEHELGDAKITILGPSKDFYMKCIANSNKTPEPANNFIQTFSNYIALTKQKSVEPYAKGQIKWNDDEGTSEINESSLIFLFEYEKQRFLFTGDAGKLGLSQAIEFAQSKQIDLKDLTLIKMPHHGSRKNVDPKLMDQLGNGETICVVSCVKGDDGHHPSKRLVNMLIEKGFKVFSTAGTILCKSYNNPPSRAGYGSVNPLPPYGNLEIL